ncbi:MAG: IclR family transcriptional regulator [Anaerolineae bacterium]|nr:IclR family transcriptional regulator [Anaerolineae bacterium]
MTKQVAAVQKAFTLLELLGQAERGLGISELAESSGLPLGTTHRLLHTLIALGYIEQDPDTRKYTLGLRFLQLRGQVIGRLNLAALAMPHLKLLMHRVNETVHLAVLNDGEVVYVDRVEGLQTQGMFTQIGKRGPIHCTALGKVLAAFSPEEVWREAIAKHGMPRRTPATIVDPEAFAAELQKVREQGYAIDNVESEPGVRCVAAPIRDYSGRVIAAVSISGPAARMRPARDQELSIAVRRTAHAISERLGYSGS